MFAVSRDHSKLLRHRERQARYAARLRDGTAIYPVVLGVDEIETLISLGWLRDGAEADREQVGAAVASGIRRLRKLLTCQRDRRVGMS
jgi:hypothetical protein